MSSAGHHQKKQPSEPQTAAQTSLRKQKEAEKIQAYKGLNDAALLKRTNKEYDSETLDLTTKLLTQNSEYYTMWNLRRQCLIAKFPTQSADENQNLCANDLKFSAQCLKQNPKSYWVWLHRRWVLEHMPQPPWDAELELINKMLDMDARNFHGWDYRRYVISFLEKEGKRTAKEEFDYTTVKINQNFSNYSAWHYRSRTLHKAFGSDQLDDVINNEFELIRNAIYTEPSDQSAWLYQRWVLSLVPIYTARWKNELESIKELVEIDETPSRWALNGMVHIMRHLGGQEEEIEKILLTLQGIDEDRSGFYRDVRGGEKC